MEVLDWPLDEPLDGALEALVFICLNYTSTA
jgi:hypothetical protein